MSLLFNVTVDERQTLYVEVSNRQQSSRITSGFAGWNLDV